MMELEIIKIREAVDEIIDMLTDIQKDIEYIKKASWKRKRVKRKKNPKKKAPKLPL